MINPEGEPEAPQQRSKGETQYRSLKLRRIIRNFTPSWFAITMGTGIISILLYKLPYNGSWLYWISVLIFALDTLLFVSFLIISALRYICYPEIWHAMIRHPTESLFLGTCPMGLGIIVQCIVNICVPAWGSWATDLAWALWWVEVVGSVAICLYLPFVTMSVHKGEISSVTTIWLLPIVPAVICSATGAMVAGELNNSAHALWTLVVSYILWGIGLPLAMFTLVLYYYRLTIHNIPAPALISSAFLPLGPLGEGGFAIMKMGQVSLTIFSATDTLIPDSGKIVYTTGFLTALLLWGFGLAWLSWAMMSFVRPTTEFNMGWWSIVFATGVFAGSTITLGQEMNSRFFNILGTVMTVIIIVFWIGVLLRTVLGTISGTMLSSPSVVQLDRERALGHC